MTKSDDRPCGAQTRSGRRCKRLPQPGHDRCAAHLATGKAKPGGRPRHEIDLDQLENLARLGCTVNEAASFLGVSKRTLFGRLKLLKYSKAWNRGRALAKISLRRSQFAAAERGNTRMLIHLGKRYLGQRDVPNPNPDADALEMSDNDDQKLDLSRLSDEEFKQLEYLYEKASSTAGCDGESDTPAPGDGPGTRLTGSDRRRGRQGQRRYSINAGSGRDERSPVRKHRNS